MTSPAPRKGPRVPTKCLWCARRLRKGRLFVEWCGDPCREKWHARLDEKFAQIQRLGKVVNPRPKPRRRGRAVRKGGSR